MINDFWYHIGIPNSMESFGDRMEQQQKTEKYNKKMERIALLAVFLSVLGIIF